jgi:P27 family predicted phage terminase small subunit
VTARQSAAVIDLHGNASKVDVEARAGREVRPDPIAPKMPKSLSPGAKAVWRSLAPELERDALLTRRDLISFSNLCESAALAAQALADMRPDKRKGFVLLDVDESHQGRTRRHPLLMIYRGALEDYLKLSARFGLSPKDRIPLELGAPPVDDGDEDEDADLFE